MPLIPEVALVTGAYYPEISSSGQQCRDVARALVGRVRFVVVTTAVDRALPGEADVEGVHVYRVPIDVTSRASRAMATLRLLRILVGLRRRIHIVHLHGISSKNVLVTWFARLTGKRIVLTLHTAGQDEPAAVRARSASEYRSLLRADRVLAVSPLLAEGYRAACLPAAKLFETFNGVDLDRFRPATAAEKRALRAELGLPGGPVVLFVGFFSRDKRPDVLFDAWTSLAARSGTPPALVYVGATSSPYFEVDAGIAERMRARADELGLGRLLVFVPPTLSIEKYFRAATVFALPSVREAMPMALLEAMACGLPCVASRLAGSTATIVDDGKDGRLVAPDDAVALGAALASILESAGDADRLGAAARTTIEERYGIERAAGDWADTYRQVLTA